MRPTAGVTFGGRYELVSRIAIGGMGEVWQATDSVIGRTVAIKILKDEYLGDPNFLERFRSEARHAALVNHEGIANVYDYGEEEGSAFLVMELVPGEALSTILERERVLPSDQVLDFVAQTALALQAAHSAGLVHRDIKPGNLLITPDHRVKITDFGIARIADQVPLTATGQVMGTVQYLSPEQASGHPASPSTDIYSLGIVAYEALAGKRPFTGESQVAIAMAQINEAPPELPVTVAEPVRNLVFSMIAKNPNDRPASAAHVARAAQALRRGDVAAAAAAVPAIADGLGSTRATQVLSPASDAATTLLATASTRLVDADGRELAEDGDAQKKKKNVWIWALTGLIVVLALVLGATIFALNNGATPEPTPTQTEPEPVETTPEPVETEETLIPVNSNDIVGRDAAEVVAELNERGLVATLSVGNAAPTPADVGKVSAVTPTGELRPGTAVTVTAYGDVAAIPKPSAQPSINCSAEGCVQGTEATISWPAFSCPAGGTLQGYNLSLTGGTLQGSFPNNVIPAGVLSVRVTLGTAPGPLTASYAAVCSSGTSPSSDANSLSIVAPAAPAPSATTPAEGGGTGNGGNGTGNGTGAGTGGRTGTNG